MKATVFRSGIIDHTILKPDATAKTVERFCGEAAQYRFRSVCVNPCRVSLAVSLLRGEHPFVCSVAGFPLGAGPATALEAERAVSLGAGEIDMVLPIGHLKDGDTGAVLRLLKDTVKAAAVPVKVIIEACLLTDPEKALACRLSVEAGAACVKTSTGFSVAGAVASDVSLMRRTVGPDLQVKASGGIRTLEEAVTMITAGATILGTGAGVQIMREYEERRPEG